MHLDPVISKGARGKDIITLGHHQAAGKNTDPAFQNAHIYVHFKAVYTLALKQGLGKGDCRHICGA